MKRICQLNKEVITVNLLEYYKQNEEDFLIKKHSKHDLWLVAYRNLGVDWSKPHYLDARGCVLDSEGNFVQRPYQKFFNYHEFDHYDSEVKHSEDIINRTKWLDDKDFYFTEKLDGSLIKVSTYKNELLITTSKSFDNELIDKAEKFIYENFDVNYLKLLCKKNTIMFEYIAPDNQIVIKYDQEDLVLHGIVNTDDGTDWLDKDDDIVWFIEEIIAEGIRCNYAEYISSFDANNAIKEKILKDRDDRNDIEGYVIHFINGHKLKIKTDEYLRLHRKFDFMFGETFTKRKILMVLNAILNDEIDDIQARVNELDHSEMKRLINEVYQAIGYFEKLTEVAVQIKSEISNREYAINYGTDTLIDKLVLNLGSHTKVDKLRSDYVLDYVLNGGRGYSWIKRI